MSMFVNAEINPNLLPPRTAMGLPETLIDRLGADVLTRHADLLHLKSDCLVEILESIDIDLTRRFAAGTVLAFIGDPRIIIEEPNMIALPGKHITLGLSPKKVDEVLARWRHLNLQPEWIKKECPEYVADIKSFSIARFPVTNLEYRIFLEETDSPWLPTSWLLGVYPSQLANHPVWTIPPEAADAYAVWISQRTGRNFRLPTEAEWEYAASCGDGREFPWGQEFDAQRTNTLEKGPLCTTPVGMYHAGRTSTGIDDLAGNVEEYTADSYRPYPGGEMIRDDLQLVQSDYRVARGGSFSRYGDLTRCRRRHGRYASPIYAIGFRLAESV